MSLGGGKFSLTGTCQNEQSGGQPNDPFGHRRGERDSWGAHLLSMCPCLLLTRSSTYKYRAQCTCTYRLMEGRTFHRTTLRNSQVAYRCSLHPIHQNRIQAEHYWVSDQVALLRRPGHLLPGREASQLVGEPDRSRSSQIRPVHGEFGETWPFLLFAVQRLSVSFSQDPDPFRSALARWIR